MGSRGEEITLEKSFRAMNVGAEAQPSTYSWEIRGLAPRLSRLIDFQLSRKVGIL
jgi:hypothetical protein